MTEFYARGVVIGDRHRLARAIAATLQGEAPLRDGFLMPRFGWVCRDAAASTLIEFSVHRQRDLVAVWLYLVGRDNAVITSRKYVYTEQDYIGQIADNAADRFSWHVNNEAGE